VLAWALYDCANSGFATSVVVFFPLLFKEYLASAQAATTSTFWLGLITAASSLVLAVIAPRLGIIADTAGSHVRLLTWFAALGIVATALLAFVGGGQWPLAAVLFGIASLGFSGSLIFYDALLLQVAPNGRVNSVSGFGYAVGYLAGGLLLALNVLMYARPHWFGLPDAEIAVRMCFPLVALWWCLFSIPIARWLPAQAQCVAASREARCDRSINLLTALRGAVQQRGIALFLVAYWMYIDGVNTVTRMAVDYGLALQFPAQAVIGAMLITQFVGFPSTFLFGRLADRVSPLLGIFVGILVYSWVTLRAAAMTQVEDLYWLAAAIGCVQGVIQSMSRSYYARLIPLQRAGEFYGLYNMVGKLAAVVGPLMMGTIALVSGSSRMSVVGLLVLFLGGGALLLLGVLRERSQPAPTYPTTTTS
jgi:UMF1 family MFS transporter